MFSDKIVDVCLEHLARSMPLQSDKSHDSNGRRPAESYRWNKHLDRQLFSNMYTYDVIDF